MLSEDKILEYLDLSNCKLETPSMTKLAQGLEQNKTMQKSKNYHDPNWDPTRDRAEAMARERMERGY